ncbi:MAG: AAA family ATPase, partial [Planctomycetes bacterium]|nr:AAA family ATPase [Planctomycetota bacterium]
MAKAPAILGQETLPVSAPEASGEEGNGEQVFGGRFRALRLLKKGQGMETFLGRDLAQGSLVVIKAASLPALAPGAQMRLEHEAEVLARAGNPHLPTVLDHGRQGDCFYLALPYVPGMTLEERLHQGPLSVRDALTVGQALLTALEEAHRQGVLHRDVKPSNIIVDEGTPLQKVNLIDFGLARSARLDASLRDQPVGTARYMAPEQAGLLDHEVDECSDLYSAGLVLFECLAGFPPFQGETVGEVLRQHLAVRPPELRSLGLAVPRTLDEILQRLLRKDPRDRYQSAGAVVADLITLAEALERGEADPEFVIGLHDRRRTLTQPAFVGRSRELALLDAQLEQALSGQGGLVLVEAESGGGKSRLLSELAQRGLRGGFWVLRGQGLDQAAARPFQVLVGVAGELVAAARVDLRLAETLRERLGDQRQALGAALPELAEILGWPTEETLGPETFGQARSLQALTSLLDVLGSQERPALVLLDDCQWADELTLKLLKNWQGRRETGDKTGRRILLVAAFRSEEVSADHPLRNTGPLATLVLPPFQVEDVRRLAESMAGPLPPEAVELIERLAEGSPFMAAAVLYGLVESGALIADVSGWRVEPAALAHAQSSSHAADFLAHRIDLLPAGTVPLLSAGAILGKEFDLDFAVHLAGQTPSQAIRALDEARHRHMVWVQGAETHCVFIHDKLRRSFLDRLSAAEQEDLHRRAALYLEQLDPDRNFEIAYHFDAAGDYARALPFALAAAQQARAQYSLEIAEQQYRIAERGAQKADQDTRFRIAEELGDVFMLRGRYDQAARQFQTAGLLAQGQLARARIQGKLGELAFKRGDKSTAGEALEEALRLLGRTIPRSLPGFLVLVLWEILVQVLHTCFPRLLLGRRPLTGAEEEFLALRLYSRLCHVYWFHRGRVPTLWAHLREMNLAERYPPTLELAQAYSEHAPAMTLIPLIRRGIAYVEKSLAIRQAKRDLWGQGQSLHYYGVLLLTASRFSECIDK